MKEKIEEAVKRIKGKEKLNEVLDDYPSEMRGEILKALREAKASLIQDSLNEVRIAKVAIFEAQKIIEAKGAPEKVKEMARAMEKDQGYSPEKAYRIAWETYCSYVNPDYEGCTSKGKSMRKSPKSAR